MVASARTTPFTSREFIAALKALTKNTKGANAGYFRGDDKETKFLDVRMASIFALAKQFDRMQASEVGKLLDSDYYEARMGAVRILRSLCF